MPSDLWEVIHSPPTPYLKARRPIKPDDWERFHLAGAHLWVHLAQVHRGVYEYEDFWSLRLFPGFMSHTPTTTETEPLYATFRGEMRSRHAHKVSYSAAPPTAAKMPHTLLASSTITADTLRHLFSFRALSRVVLAAPGGFDLNDAVIDAMARAGLRALAHYCKQLRFLHMGFDASVVPDEEQGQPKSVHDQTELVQNTLSLER
ncbi:hypothetical protein B0H14DRAFT_3472576 [Mycena olivaceomarginata]|nr:hypothetical protein B0H14DRAFT_3472576 [Mycena olivaceomarginata]